MENEQPELILAEREINDLIDAGHCLESAAKELNLPMCTSS